MMPTAHGAASGSTFLYSPSLSRDPPGAGPLNAVLGPKDPQPGWDTPQPPAESHLAPRRGREPQSESQGSLPASLQGTHHGGAQA